MRHLRRGVPGRGDALKRDLDGLRDDGRLFLLEANPNPDISRDEELAGAAKAAGYSYEALIQTTWPLFINTHYGWTEQQYAPILFASTVASAAPLCDAILIRCFFLAELAVS